MANLDHEVSGFDSEEEDDSFDGSGIRPATPPNEDNNNNFPRKSTHIHAIPPVGNSLPPPRKVLSQANKESMYLGSCLLSAVRAGDEREVSQWLRAGRSMGLAVAMDVKTGKSTLHYAAEAGRLSICKLLVDAGAVQTNMDKYGKTPLHLAVINGHLTVVHFLLSNITPYMFHVPSKATLVHEAVRRGHVVILQALLTAGFYATETNGAGETALHIAARFGDLALAKLLILNKANVHAVTRTLGQTPLHYACIYGNTEVACFLVRRGADAHLPDASPSRKTAVDKCEDCAHRATLNAVLNAAKEYRDLVADLDEADRRAHAYEVQRVEAFTRRAGGRRRLLARQAEEEAVLVEKHKAIERMLRAVAQTTTTTPPTSAPGSSASSAQSSRLLKGQSTATTTTATRSKGGSGGCLAGGAGGAARVVLSPKPCSRTRKTTSSASSGGRGGGSSSSSGSWDGSSDEENGEAAAATVSSSGGGGGGAGGNKPKKKLILGFDRVQALQAAGKRLSASNSSVGSSSDRYRSSSMSGETTSSFENDGGQGQGTYQYNDSKVWGEDDFQDQGMGAARVQKDKEAEAAASALAESISEYHKSKSGLSATSAANRLFGGGGGGAGQTMDEVDEGVLRLPRIASASATPHTGEMGSSMGGSVGAALFGVAMR
jgi:ankyrin repeat protein